MNNSSCKPYLPPEWAEQSGVMVTWPHDRGDWGDNVASVAQTLSEMVAAIVRHEPCLVVCRDMEHRQRVEQMLADIAGDRLFFAIAESNDIWARDHGPLTVVCQNEPELLNFRFNGWGGKYRHNLDNAITPTLFKNAVFGDSPMEDVEFVLEGGAVEVDGSGTFMATRHSVITDTRNPGLDQAAIEKILSERFGLHRFIWLEHGALEGDDTDGHIDTLARFVDRDTIAYCSCDDENDSHFTELQAMKAELEQAVTVNGEPYKLVPLPLPSAKFNRKGHRLPATYANFLIINNAVLVPTYDDAKDSVALERLRTAFAGRDVVAIDCQSLIRQYGSLHCATMQFPRGVHFQNG